MGSRALDCLEIVHMAVKNRELMMGWVGRGKMGVGDDRKSLLVLECCPKRWVGRARARPVERA